MSGTPDVCIEEGHDLEYVPETHEAECQRCPATFPLGTAEDAP